MGKGLELFMDGSLGVVGVGVVRSAAHVPKAGCTLVQSLDQASGLTGNRLMSTSCQSYLNR